MKLLRLMYRLRRFLLVSMRWRVLFFLSRATWIKSAFPKKWIASLLSLLRLLRIRIQIRIWIQKHHLLCWFTPHYWVFARWFDRFRSKIASLRALEFCWLDPRKLRKSILWEESKRNCCLITNRKFDRLCWIVVFVETWLIWFLRWLKKTERFFWLIQSPIRFWLESRQKSRSSAFCLIRILRVFSRVRRMEMCSIIR